MVGCFEGMIKYIIATQSALPKSCQFNGPSIISLQAIAYNAGLSRLPKETYFINVNGIPLSALRHAQKVSNAWNNTYVPTNKIVKN